MNRLTVRDCLWSDVVRVLEEERPEAVSALSVFAIFRESVETGIFCGLATEIDIIQHPNWIFADLAEHREYHCVSPDISVGRALRIMNQHGLNVLPVLERQSFEGVVTQHSILNMLLQRERALRKKARILNKLLADEHKQVVSWSTRLAKLHEASRSLLTVLAHTSIQSDLLQMGVESLSKLLEARYGAIGILDESGGLQHFVFTGIGPELAERIGPFPQGKGLLGLVIQENVSLRLDDMSTHPQSAGFPPHHPLMKTLLAVPIAHRDRVYGRIYLSDKENGEPFNQQDEDLALSFAHSLSLVLDNAREIEEVKLARQSLDYMAHFDHLTGLPNRTLLKDRVDQAIYHAHRNRRMIGVLFLDLDNFKLVNDTLGHTCGDQLLKCVARRISDCLREGDTAVRLGGDEFIVLLPDLTDTQDAAKVASKVLESLQPPFAIDRHEVYVSASIGISIYPHNANNMEELLSSADGSMYYAKKLGKNNYQFFTPEMNGSAQTYIKLEKHLRRALEQDEFMLHYQPQVDVKTGTIIGMEALIRWISPELGMVSPADFIPLAEDTGLIVPIGAWVLKTACLQARSWQKIGRPTRVAVNLSSRQFHPVQTQQGSQHPLLNAVLNALDEADLSPELLELEITESILMQHLDSTMELLNTLKNIGVRLSIDDFGTGYSSLSYLKRFPIDILKIDKSFVNDITTDPSDKAIVAAITAMAKQLNLEVVAEGVETLAQLDFLCELQCDFVQGYYFSKPLSPDEVMTVQRQGILVG
ncbi:EAL domain-containing protein [Methylomonas sp. SURF-2]|uniref:EAL domain-containing protein n=1 Tax=Methylomonas subterranea TaxID=2952225 RepID=A0ABT1TD47_9GAMM|nr:EAL domain-containing protein [Methylomonas sp. SURF-2]MCQ8103186.1 EAL domain-containing protein [Methylomonas sp. SURF-2]